MKHTYKTMMLVIKKKKKYKYGNKWGEHGPSCPPLKHAPVYHTLDQYAPALYSRLKPNDICGYIIKKMYTIAIVCRCGL